MVRPTLALGIEKLAVAGQQAGFSIEQMIELLNAGLDVESLLDLIAWQLEHPRQRLRLLLHPVGFSNHSSGHVGRRPF